MDEMRALRAQGKPLVVRKKLQVIPNPLAGVYESYEVDMIFCFNGEFVNNLRLAQVLTNSKSTFEAHISHFTES